MPRGGGLGLAVAAVVVLGLSGKLVGAPRGAVLTAAVGMAVIGLTDDARTLEALPRFIAQVVVASVTVLWLLDDLRVPAPWSILVWVGSASWIVAFVNVFNFMDGINGISVAQVIVAGATWVVIGQTQNLAGLSGAALVMVGAAVGFAPFNAYRPRMFLGDVGSYFLGGGQAALVVIGLRAGAPPEAMLAPLCVYVADTTTTLFSRVRRHQEWYRPHREHVYQRLVQAGWTHARTSLTAGSTMAACSAFALLSLTPSLLLRIAGDGLAAATVLSYLATPAVLTRRRTGTWRPDTEVSG